MFIQERPKVDLRMEEIQRLYVECKKGIYFKNLKDFHSEWVKEVMRYPKKRWWAFWRKKSPTFRKWIIKQHEGRMNSPLWELTMNHLSSELQVHLIEKCFEEGIIYVTHEQALEIRKLKRLARCLENNKKYSHIAKIIRNKRVLRALGDVE